MSTALEQRDAAREAAAHLAAKLKEAKKINARQDAIYAACLAVNARTFKRSEDGESIYDGNGKRVARMSRNLKNWKANARLFVASPDLLTTLRAIVADADKRPGGDNPMQEISRDVLCDARLLLAKLEKPS